MFPRHEADRLRRVLLSPPLEKYDIFHFDYYDLLIHDFGAMPDLKKACIQHQRLIDVYNKNGVKVEIVEPSARFPNLCFVDNCAVITPQGAILSNFNLRSRRGEEKIVEQKLRELGIKIHDRIRVPREFEGGSNIYILGETAIIGNCTQSNPEGIKQMSEAIRLQGIHDVRIFEEAGMHLDGRLGVVSRDTLVVHEDNKDDKSLHGFNVIPVPRPPLTGGATNVVLLKEWRVVADENNKEGNKIMEKEGVDVIAVNLSEFGKMYGGPHCLTLHLDREP